MAKTMISLLSEQRMQHVIPLLHRKLDLEQVLWIGSGPFGKVEERFALIAREVVSAFDGRVRGRVHPQGVDPMDALQVARVVAQAVEHCGGARQVLVNVTGGTKPMAIGAYQAAREAGADAVYVDSEQERLIHYLGDRMEIQPFDLHPLSVVRYLRIHGKELDEERSAQRALREEEVAMARALREGGSRWLDGMFALQALVEEGAVGPQGDLRLKLERVRFPEGMLDRAVSLGLLHRAEGRWLLSGAWREFFRGGWLEAYVCEALRATGAFMDVVARRHLRGAASELDVAFVLNAKFGVVECKRGRPRGRQDMDRLYTLREYLGGSFGRAFLVSGRARQNMGLPALERAGEYRIHVISRKDLARVDQVILREMGGAQARGVGHER